MNSLNWLNLTLCSGLRDQDDSESKEQTSHESEGLRPVARLCANQIFEKTLQLPPRLPGPSLAPSVAASACLKPSESNAQLEPLSEACPA